MATRTSYYIGGFIAGAPAQNRSEQWDGTAGTYTAWDASGNQTTQRALTTAEASDLAAQDAASTASTNRATIQTSALNALTTNRAYSNLASPTAAQTTAEVKALAQQMNGVLRLLLNQLDATN